MFIPTPPPPKTNISNPKIGCFFLSVWVYFQVPDLSFRGVFGGEKPTHPPGSEVISWKTCYEWGELTPMSRVKSAQLSIYFFAIYNGYDSTDDW